MPVTAVAVDEVIASRVKNGGGPNGDGFLPAIQMAEPTDLLSGTGVFLIGPLFEPADEHHHPQSVSFKAAIGLLRRAAPLYVIGYCHFNGSIDCLGRHRLIIAFRAIPPGIFPGERRPSVMDSITPSKPQPRSALFPFIGHRREILNYLSRHGFQL
jgi:hypothetical protein